LINYFDLDSLLVFVCCKNAIITKKAKVIQRYTWNKYAEIFFLFKNLICFIKNNVSSRIGALNCESVCVYVCVYVCVWVCVRARAWKNMISSWEKVFILFVKVFLSQQTFFFIFLPGGEKKIKLFLLDTFRRVETIL